MEQMKLEDYFTDNAFKHSKEKKEPVLREMTTEEKAAYDQLTKNASQMNVTDFIH